MVEFNGEYGCLGDLGMHVCHLPFRAGWIPRNVRAILSNIVAERPDGRGGRAPCETWDNATLLCETAEPSGQYTFPMTLKTHRIAPGEGNTWYVEILGTRASARSRRRIPSGWSGSNTPAASRSGARLTRPPAGVQEHHRRHLRVRILRRHSPDVGGLPPRAGDGRPAARFAGCVTPEETALSHRLFTAALLAGGVVRGGGRMSQLTRHEQICAMLGAPASARWRSSPPRWA